MSLFVIRTDASTEIGTGHVSRCLTLSSHLTRQGMTVVFIMRQLEGNMIQRVQNMGYQVMTITDEKADDMDWKSDAKACSKILTDMAQDVHWLIVDHYILDRNWETELSHQVENIMVIDDLANRPHQCRILLDQNLYHNMQQRYKDLVGTDTVLLLGPRYVLLRDEFLSMTSPSKIYQNGIRNALIYYGGSDPTGETIKAIEALSIDEFRHIDFTVIIGDSCPHRIQVERLCDELANFTMHRQVSNIAEIMSNSDLAVGACGTSTWERCYFGLPTISTEIAANQTELSMVLDEMGAIYNLGWYNKVSIETLRAVFRAITTDSQKLTTMSLAAQAIIHQQGYRGAAYIASVLCSDRLTDVVNHAH